MEKQQTRRILYDVSDPTFWNLVQRQGILYTDTPLYLGQNGICLYRKAEECEKNELDLFLSGSEIIALETISKTYPRMVRIRFLNIRRPLDVTVLARDPAKTIYGRQYCFESIGNYHHANNYELRAYVSYNQTTPLVVHITIDQTFYQSNERKITEGCISATYAQQLVTPPPAAGGGGGRPRHFDFTHIVLPTVPDPRKDHNTGNEGVRMLELPAEIQFEQLLRALTQLLKTPEFIIQFHKASR